MLENIQEKEEEVKKIWLEHRDRLKTKKIFFQFLGDYFDVSHYSDKTPIKEQLKDPDWRFFVIWVREWRRKERKEKQRKEAGEMTDEEAEELQNLNRKKAIIMLRDILSRYEKNPIFFQNLTARDISLIYKTIQDAEEAMRRTKLARSKLGLEAAKTFFLPYQRMSPEELKLLKAKLDVSFERLLQLRAPELTE